MPVFLSLGLIFESHLETFPFCKNQQNHPCLFVTFLTQPDPLPQIRNFSVLRVGPLDGAVSGRVLRRLIRALPAGQGVRLARLKGLKGAGLSAWCPLVRGISPASKDVQVNGKVIVRL